MRPLIGPGTMAKDSGIGALDTPDRVRDVKVRQYVYLGITSDDLDPGVISERLGLMPDEVKLRGSRHQGPPPVPRTHLWRFNSGLTSEELPLDDHFESLRTRLGDSAARLGELLRTEHVSAVVQVVRYFEPGPEDRHITEPGRHVGDYERVRGQHPLVGFDIAPDLVAFAAEAGIGFDFDEYGDEDE